MNILYGVPGEGMGHATRSKVVIDHLLRQGHELCIVASGRAFAFLNAAFPKRVVEIKGFHFAYRNAEISIAKTFFSNLKVSGKNLVYNTAKKKLIERHFVPQVVITDFESFSFLFAKEHGLPVISIDNMQVMDRCELEVAIPAGERNNYRLAKQIVRAKVPGCQHYLVSSFFDAPVRKKNTTVVPPIVRQAIQDAPVLQNEHVLVYQTSSSLKSIREVLAQLPGERFFVYGMNEDSTERNVTFKPFSEEGFIADLAGAKAVVANGGFSLLSECVYLHKPVYTFPIRNQFEQWMNAAYIEKCGFGRHFDTLHADALKSFLYDLPMFQARLRGYRQKGNAELFTALETLLNTLL